MLENRAMDEKTGPDKFAALGACSGAKVPGGGGMMNASRVALGPKEQNDPGKLGPKG